MEISWEDLGSPQSPSDVRVPGVGIIGVRQKDIDLANEISGNPICELADATSMDDGIRRYLITLIN